MNLKTKAVIYVLGFAALAYAAFAPSVYADLPGWDYRATVRITNSLTGALTDYQVLLTVNTAALVSALKMDARDRPYISAGTDTGQYAGQ